MPEKINAIFTFEILGKPPEHIAETLSLLIDKLGEQKGIKIKDRKIHEPKEIEREGKSQGFFTTFAEVEVEAENMNLIIGITLNMLPSHVEIISPTEFRFKSFELSSLLTELTIKIHKYDEISKAMLFERKNILNRLRESEERCRELEKEISEKKAESKEKTEKDKNSEEK